MILKHVQHYYIKRKIPIIVLKLKTYIKRKVLFIYYKI